MRNRRGVLAFIIVTFIAVLLTACSGTTVTTGPKGATYKFNKLTEDDDNEETAQFHFDDGILTVSLESGTANFLIRRISLFADEEDDDIFDELDTIYEGHDLKDGDKIEISGLRGDVVMRLWGNAGKGTVKIEPK